MMPDTPRPTGEDAARSPAYSPAMLPVVARELIMRSAEDQRLTKEATARKLPHLLKQLRKCRRTNADALAGIVSTYGWPTVELVKEQASVAALMILLHATSLEQQLNCLDLIRAAVDRGDSPAIHLAYIDDQCNIAQRRKQLYGTCIDPASGAPYPIHDPSGVDARRKAAGMTTLAEQMSALRAGTHH
jgi:hypothetical protein